MNEIIIGWNQHGYIVTMRSNRKDYVFEAGDEFGDLTDSLLEYLEDPFPEAKTQKYSLIIKDEAKEILGESHSNVLEIIVKHHNNIV